MKQSLLAIVSILILCFGRTNAQTNTNIQHTKTDAIYTKDLLKVGTMAPNFSLKTYDNRTIRLSDFRGRYLVIDFWASWCSDCRKDIPAIKELYNKYSTQGVDFLGISFDTDKEQWAKTYWNTYQMPWTQVSELKKWKKNTHIDKLYNVKWIPTMYLIDPHGKIVFATTDINHLKEALESINPSKRLNTNTPKAQFKGGQKAFEDFIKKNLIGVHSNKNANVRADVVVQFTVMFDGQVIGAHVIEVNNIKANGPKYEKMSIAKQQEFIQKKIAKYKAEAVRFMSTKSQLYINIKQKPLSQMPNWEPATIGGRPVQTSQTVTLSFGCI